MISEIPVLDKGYVKLTGTLVTTSDDKTCAQTLDEMVVEAARVSFGDGLKGPEKDRKLLHYLLEHEHGTPFESAVFKFEVKCPIYVQRQWRTHRWGSFNEISGRYTDDIGDDFYTPKIFRAQDTVNKQGSTNQDLSDQKLSMWPLRLDFPLDIAQINGENSSNVTQVYEQMLQTEKEIYNRMIEAGVAKEIARGVLGTAFYTKFVWVVNARSLMNFLILRCESHAQWEIQEYAKPILSIFKEQMPWTYEAFVKLFPTIFANI